MELLIINGHDYSGYVARKGIGWSRNDLDSDNTTRTKSGNLRRDKITTKRKLSYTVMNMTQEELAQLDNDLSEATFSVRYLDLHGPMTRKFYCSSFSATLLDSSDNNPMWDGASFNITEA